MYNNDISHNTPKKSLNSFMLKYLAVILLYAICPSIYLVFCWLKHLQKKKLYVHLVVAGTILNR